MTSTNPALNRYGRLRSALYRADMAMGNPATRKPGIAPTIAIRTASQVRSTARPCPAGWFVMAQPYLRWISSFLAVFPDRSIPRPTPERVLGAVSIGFRSVIPQAPLARTCPFGSLTAARNIRVSAPIQTRSWTHKFAIERSRASAFRREPNIAAWNVC